MTVPDAGELDQLRTWGGVYRRGLYTTGNRDNAPPERTRSLPASSCESSMEPMDTDDARRASEEIYSRIRQKAGLSRSGSVGDVTLQPEPLGVMTQGRLVLQRRTSEGRLIQMSLGIYRVLYMFFWPAEFPGYYQCQQESQ